MVILEGAGSPAEINLADIDAANLMAARAADAAVLLVTDIDRGGAFAHLYGTWALQSEEDRQWIAGFVLNKFRGDASLLAPAPERLTELTGMSMLGVVPWLQHGLPDEDGAAHPAPAPPKLPAWACSHCGPDTNRRSSPAESRRGSGAIRTAHGRRSQE